MIGQGVFFRRWWRCGGLAADTMEGSIRMLLQTQNSGRNELRKPLRCRQLVDNADPELDGEKRASAVNGLEESWGEGGTRIWVVI